MKEGSLHVVKVLVIVSSALNKEVCDTFGATGGCIGVTEEDVGEWLIQHLVLQ